MKLINRFSKRQLNYIKLQKIEKKIQSHSLDEAAV